MRIPIASLPVWEKHKSYRFAMATHSWEVRFHCSVEARVKLRNFGSGLSWSVCMFCPSRGTLKCTSVVFSGPKHSIGPHLKHRMLKNCRSRARVIWISQWLRDESIKAISTQFHDMGRLNQQISFVKRNLSALWSSVCCSTVVVKPILGVRANGAQRSERIQPNKRFGVNGRAKRERWIGGLINILLGCERTDWARISQAHDPRGPVGLWRDFRRIWDKRW
jgi:hypothetical protein